MNSTTRPTPTVFPTQFTDPDAAAALHERNKRIAHERDLAVFGERTRREAEIHSAYVRGRDEGYNRCLYERHTSGFHWGFTCGAVCAALGSAFVILFRDDIKAAAATVARLFA